MDLYLLLKLVHVVTATLWIGGVAFLALLVAVTDRRGDDAATLGVVSLLGLAGRHVFSRASHATLGTGLVLAWLGGWSLAPWIVLSVLLAALGFLYLRRVIGPGMGRVAARRLAGDMAGAAALARLQLRRIAADLSVKAAIIALMILKPGWTDPLLLVPAACLLLGAALHLSGPARVPAAQPA